MTEPRRLFNLDRDSELTRALREAQRDLGTSAQMNVLHARLSQQLAAPAAAASPSPMVKAVSLAPVKAVVALVIAVGGSVATYHWFLAGHGIATSVGQRELPRKAEPVAVSDSTLPNAPQSPVVPKIAAPASATRVQVETAASRPPRMIGASAPRSARAKPAPTAPATPAANDPDAEVALISSAQQALDRDPARALGFVAQHERRFAHGVLAEEREVLRVDALIALGRNADALVSARAFVARFGNSPQRPRIQAWIAAQTARCTATIRAR